MAGTVSPSLAEAALKLETDLEPWMLEYLSQLDWQRIDDGALLGDP